MTLLHRTALLIVLAFALAPSAQAAESFTVAQQLRTEVHLTSTGACFDLSLTYYNKLTAAGIDARMVAASATTMNDYDSHTFVEVQRNGRWVIQDPTFDGGWDLGGNLVGVAEMQAALGAGTWRQLRFVGRQEPIRGYYFDPRLLVRYVSLFVPIADGKWQTLERTIVPMSELYYAQADKPADATAGLIVAAQSGQVRNYPLAQLSDGRWVSPVMTDPDPTDGQVLWVPRYSDAVEPTPAPAPPTVTVPVAPVAPAVTPAAAPAVKASPGYVPGGRAFLFA